MVVWISTNLQVMHRACGECECRIIHSVIEHFEPCMLIIKRIDILHNYRKVP
jgi:hypothetical protein